MSAVYEVLHTETRRKRALKVMLPELVQDAGLRDRFSDEARVTANIDSEFIVDVHDAGVDTSTGLPFLVMELLRGEDLGARVQRLGPQPPTDVTTYLTQVASALDKTHEATIVHRDLKPENLFLTTREDGSPRVKILDFGIAKVLRPEALPRPKSSGVLGTPLYMAPEQLLGREPSPATDIHALGLIAFTLLTGRPYWHEEYRELGTPIAFGLKISKGVVESAIVRASRQGCVLPESFDGWFFRASHPEPAQRFEWASEAIAALAKLDFTVTERARPGAVGLHDAEPREATVTQPDRHSSLRPAVSGPSGTPARSNARRLAWIAASATSAGLIGILLQQRTEPAAVPSGEVSTKSDLRPQSMPQPTPPSAEAVQGGAKEPEAQISGDAKTAKPADRKPPAEPTGVTNPTSAPPKTAEPQKRKSASRLKQPPAALPRPSATSPTPKPQAPSEPPSNHDPFPYP